MDAPERTPSHLEIPSRTPSKKMATEIDPDIRETISIRPISSFCHVIGRLVQKYANLGKKSEISALVALGPTGRVNGHWIGCDALPPLPCPLVPLSPAPTPHTPHPTP